MQMKIVMQMITFTIVIRIAADIIGQVGCARGQNRKI